MVLIVKQRAQEYARQFDLSDEEIERCLDEELGKKEEEVYDVWPNYPNHCFIFTL